MLVVVGGDVNLLQHLGEVVLLKKGGGGVHCKYHTEGPSDIYGLKLSEAGAYFGNMIETLLEMKEAALPGR